MLARNKIIFCLFSFFILLIIIDSVQNVARSYSDVFLTNYNCTNSPLDGKSCAFTGCHTGAAPITIPGLITSNIPPAGYTPGVTYSLTASLNRPGHTHFGFSISPQNGAQILGTLVVTDANRTYASYPGGGYITHKRNGVANTNSASWSFDWIAPAAGSGTVIFYGSLLACESSGAVYTSLGDTTFLSTLTIAENVCNVPGPAGCPRSGRTHRRRPSWSPSCFHRDWPCALPSYAASLVSSAIVSFPSAVSRMLPCAIPAWMFRPG